MSSRDSRPKSRAPAHQNKTAFKHNKNSKKTKQIMALPIAGLCGHCHDKIVWRKKFRKYKPRTVAGKCLLCQQKNITAAYHVICHDCARKSKSCAMCREVKAIVENDTLTPSERNAEEQMYYEKLKLLRERERRTLLRQSTKKEDDDNPESSGKLEAIDSEESDYDEEYMESEPEEGAEEMHQT